jgi:hypothetical protein
LIGGAEIEEEMVAAAVALFRSHIALRIALA